MAKILVVGLNPAWQSILEFGHFKQGEVNRASAVKHLASGKGLNTAKVLCRLGHEVWLLQILGGNYGNRCLEACQALGIKSLVAWVEVETRHCLTLLDRGKDLTTEIIEPFQVNQGDTDQALLDMLPVSPEFFDGLVVSGSIPAGIPEKIYRAILSRFNADIKVVDCLQGLDAELLNKITCLKVNMEEMKSLEKQLGGLASGPYSPFCAITDGPGKAFLKHDDRVLAEFSLPKLTGNLNPIGAGDTVTAGLTHFMLNGFDVIESFRRGLAMGSASCLNLMPAEFSDFDFQRLLPKVVLSET
jgi:tagatose 6-phosphate kinase